jgi:F-box protein 21
MLVKLSDKFKELATECREFLEKNGTNLDIYAENFDLPLVAERICNWMRQQGFGPPDAARYHRISNHFPHLFLSDARKTIPLSMVCVFVAIGQHLGLQASPVNYPRKVLAHIAHPQPTGSSIWVDVTGVLGRNVLNYQLDVVAGLVDGNIDVEFPDIRSWISPASVPTMLVRSANNILNSLRMRAFDDDTPSEDQLSSGGLYGAACIMALFGGHLDFLSRMLEEDNMFVLDDKAIFVDLILNALPGHSMHRAEAVMEVNRRMNRPQVIFSRTENEVKFATGMCVHHKRFGYTGIITGWDVRRFLSSGEG